MLIIYWGLSNLLVTMLLTYYADVILFILNIERKKTMILEIEWLLDQLPANHKKILLDDFNAKIRRKICSNQQ